MDPGWAQLLIAFVGGSLMTAAITAFLTHYIVVREEPDFRLI
jgi:hypothetical protein